MSEKKNANKRPKNERWTEKGIREDSCFASCQNRKAEDGPGPTKAAAKVQRKLDRWNPSEQLAHSLNNEGETIKQSSTVGKNKEGCNVSTPRVSTPPALCPTPASLTKVSDNTVMENGQQKPTQRPENGDNDGASERVKDTPGISSPEPRKPLENLAGPVEINNNVKTGVGEMKNKTTKREDRIEESHVVSVPRKSEVIKRKTKSGKITSLQEPKVSKNDYSLSSTVATLKPYLGDLW